MGLGAFYLGIQNSNAQMSTGHSNGAFECSDGHLHSIGACSLECSDGHWAFHLGIQISNAQVGIGHLTCRFRFLLFRWAFGILPGNLYFESSDGHWGFQLSIQI